MCGGSLPPAPDPIATANAQNAVNADAIKTSAQYNQINQTNPFGSLTYTGDLGSPDRTQNTTLSPALQSLLTGQEGIAQNLTDAAGQRIQGLSDMGQFKAADNPNTYMPQSANAQLATGYNTQQAQMLDPSMNQGIQNSFAAPTTGMVSDVQAGQIQNRLNTAGVQKIAGPNAFASQSQQAQNAAYQAQTGLLAPHEQQAQSQLQSQLAAQGIEQGTPAYNQAVNNLQQSQDLIRQQAAASAVGQGNQQQQALFGENVAGSQAQFEQALQSGQFGNEAQSLAFGQGTTNAQLANSVNQQQYNQNLGAAQFNNQAQAQQFGQGMDMAGYNLAAGQANNANNAALAQFGNQAQGQQFNQGLQLGGYNQGIYQTNQANTIQDRNQNFNEAAAFLQGSPIAPNNPTFQPTSQYQAAQAAPNAIGLAGQNYQTASQNNSSLLGSIFGAAGKLGSSWIACWVAREVMPERWLEMRHWMLNKAPDDLRTTYLRSGERIAAYIADKPELKAAIRSQMEAVLG